jgi:aspartyl-tRNA(Asn)/glutamyl-tRNA(Gln) amidotransferase subunit A
MIKVKEWPTLVELADQVRSGKLKAYDLVQQCLDAIDEHSEFNAIISKISSRSLERAVELDKNAKSGKAKGRLYGIPFIAKDNFLTFGSETTAASNILKGFKAPYQSTAINRLEAEGAICVAKANLDAFAHGGSTENSDFFITKNPHDKTRVPGGSSGGSTAAVMLGLAPFALGTDTGGSIRQPASFSGVVGYKPTYGLVSRSGVVAMASSTDVVGPITKSVADTALILDCMAGRDDLDSTSIEKTKAGYSGIKPIDLSKIKLGLVKQYMDENVDKEVRSTIKSTLETVKKSGGIVKEVSLPSLELALAAYYIIAPAEISSNLSRYDGQHYGYSNKDAVSIDESFTWSRSEGFGREAKRRIMIGTYVLSSGYYDAYYKKAQTVRTKIINEFEHIFKKYDFLVGPAAPTVAFKIGENANTPLNMYLQDVMTVAVSLAGLPAIVIPAGTSKGLPVGLQIIGKAGKDAELISVANKIEEILS